VPDWLLKAPVNAEAMTKQEHENLHQHITERELIVICQALLGLASSFNEE
jgi:hypothetical protein